MAVKTTATPPKRATDTEILGPEAGVTVTIFATPSATSPDLATKANADAVVLGLELADAVFDALGVALMATPLSQTSVLPFFIHVYFLFR